MVANAELTPSNRLVIKNLSTGDLLNIRVVAVNAGGRSEPAMLPQPVVIREIMGEGLFHLFYTDYIVVYIPVAAQPGHGIESQKCILTVCIHCKHCKPL